MAEIKDTASLEAKAVEYLNLGEEIHRLEERREALKADIGQLMRLSNQEEYRFGLDPLFDVKVKVGERKSKVIDKQELATDLGVAESAINLEFLLQAVEDGKLTLQKFRQYVHQQFTESVSIRKVDADK